MSHADWVFPFKESESEPGGITGMRSNCYLVILIALACSIRSNAAELPPLPPELQSLDIASGKWEYQGDNLATSDQKAEKWTWSQDCAWSANRAFSARAGWGQFGSLQSLVTVDRTGPIPAVKSRFRTSSGLLATNPAVVSSTPPLRRGLHIGVMEERV